MRYGKQKRQELKIEVLGHYSQGSPVCKVCGITDIRVLTIDHINGGGNRQKKTVGIAGNSFYRWLREQNYPEGYQVLCFNCNWIKRDENDECSYTKTSSKPDQDSPQQSEVPSGDMRKEIRKDEVRMGENTALRNKASRQLRLDLPLV